MAGQHFASGLAVAWGALTAFTSTANPYADVGTVVTQLFKTTKLAFVGATNTMKVQVLGSIDGGATFPFTAEAEFTVAAGATEVKTITSYFTHLKVQAAPNVAATHGTITTTWAGASF